MRFEAEVFTGIGEGAMYVERYNKYFREVLGQEFFPGTLNVRTKETVQLRNGIEIAPDEPDLNEVHCYPAKLNGFSVQIVVPMVRRHGPDVLEIMAPVNLRERFGLKDRSLVEIAL